MDNKVHVFGEMPKTTDAVRAHAVKVARELDRYLNGNHKKEPRTPKFIPSNVISRTGRLVRKNGMTIVDIEAEFADDGVEHEAEEIGDVEAKVRQPKNTIEMPLPEKAGRGVQTAAS